MWKRNRGKWKMTNNSDEEATRNSDNESEVQYIQTKNNNDDDDVIEGDISNPVLLDGADGRISDDDDGMMDCNDK